MNRLAPRAIVMVLAAIALAAGARSPSSPDWFSGTAPLRLRVEAPFNELFAHAQQDGYTVRGSIVWGGEGGQRIDQAKVGVRGHTSRRQSECSFPKLKLSWPGGGVKIGTHCGEADGPEVTPKFGRLANQHSPIREAFVYRLLETLGVPTLRARPARVTYVYSDAGSGRVTPISRDGFLLEDDGAARARLGASDTISPEAFTNAREAFTAEDSARIAFGQALIGNFDWCVRFFKGDTYRCDARRPLWNVLAFAMPDGTARPVMYDFDVSGAVAGYHRWFADIFNEEFLPSRSHAAIEVTAQLQRGRTLFDRAQLDATRRAFAAKKHDAYRMLAESTVDPAGKKILTEYLDAFFDAMTSDAAFYRPVITAAHTFAYADPDRSSAVCSSVGPLPVGTPVGQPLHERGDMVQAVVLDALWKFAPPVKCPFIHQKPVWISKSAIGTNLP